MSLLLLLKAAATGGGSGDGDLQLNAGGAYILDADGNLYLKCCCGACPFCDIAPTAYDIEFTSVTDCPGDIYSPLDHTFHATGPVLGGIPTSTCSWGDLRTGTTDNNTLGSAFVDGTGAGITMANYAGGGLFFVGYFFDSGIISYGPDCSATILASNLNTSGHCAVGGVAPFVLGYGGSAVAVPVMPP